jgi:hypothetical protein
VFGIAQGLQAGGIAGNAGAALSAAGLANKAGAFGVGNTTATGALGAAGGVLGIYSGLQQGGVSGYGGAAIGALKTGQGVATMAGDTGLASGLGEAAGAIAVPLSVYNFATNWQSGATASDTIQGAETGAEIGSVIPGVGTLVGAGIGAGVGALSSLLGPGKTDPEQSTWTNFINAYSSASNSAEHGTQNATTGFGDTGGTQLGEAQVMAALGGDMPGGGTAAGQSAIAAANKTVAAATPAQLAAESAAGAAAGAKAVSSYGGAQDYQALAGLFDQRSSNLPIYQQFGRQGEGAFMTSMTNQVDSAIKNGTVSANATPAEIYSKVIGPWVDSMGGSAGATAMQDNPAVGQLLTNLIGNYQNGQSFQGVGGQAVSVSPYA